MGLLFWAVTTLFTGAAAYAVAAWVAPTRGLVQRGVVTLLFALTSVLAVMYTLGFFHALKPWPVLLASLALSGGLFALGLTRVGARRLLEMARGDAGAPVRLFREALQQPELAAYTV